jgi:dienelactone hydrolase
MPKAPPQPPPHPSWEPKSVQTSWDDLLAGAKSPADWERKRAEIKARFLSLLRHEAAPQVPRDLEIKTEAEFKGDGFSIRRISYNVESDERAAAYLAIPNGPAPADGFPAVLCIHGTINFGARRSVGLPPEPDDPNRDKPYPGMDYGAMLARNGYVTLSPEHFCCATRVPKEGPYDTAAFYRKHPRWSAIGKSTFENHIALNVLASLPYVNAERMGATGHSLGAQNTIFITAFDERIRCAAPSCAAQTFRENPEPLHWSRDYWYIYIPQLREQFLKGERVQCDFHEMMALAAPRPLLEFFALNDGDGRSQAHRATLHLTVHEIYRVLEREDAHAFLVFGDGHSLPKLSQVSLLAWMDRWLKHDGQADW